MAELLKLLNIESILSSIGIILAAVFLYAIRNWLQKLYEKMGAGDNTSMDVSTIKDKTVFDLLSEQRVTLHGARAFVVQFHNGDFFSSRKPIWKITMTHESCEPGRRYVADGYRNLAVSILLDWVLPFWGQEVRGVKRIDANCGNGVGVYWYVVNDMADGWCRVAWQARGVTHAISSPLHSQDGRIIGMVGYDFEHPGMSCPDVVDGNCSMERIGELRNTANTIGYLLSSNGKEKKK